MKTANYRGKGTHKDGEELRGTEFTYYYNGEVNWEGYMFVFIVKIV